VSEIFGNIDLSRTSTKEDFQLELNQNINDVRPTSELCCLSLKIVFFQIQTHAPNHAKSRLKYNTETIFASNGTRKLLWFEITKMLTEVFNK